MFTDFFSVKNLDTDKYHKFLRRKEITALKKNFKNHN